MALQIIVTDAGRAALVNAANTGTAPVTIAECGLSADALAPSKSAVALPGEFKRIAALSGDVVDDDTLHLIVRDESADIYSVRSLALYLDDGTLFAIYGQAADLVEKSAQALMLLAIDVRFADIDATQLTFGDANFLNPPATTDRKGVVELATDAEAIAGVDSERVATAKAIKAAVTDWLNSRFGVNNAAIWHPANDGAGSGLDADLLDGQQGSYYSNIPARLGYTPLNAATYTPGDILAKLLGVDGAGSGLDADKLDGSHAAEFATRGGPNTFVGQQTFTANPLVNIGKAINFYSSEFGIGTPDQSGLQIYAATNDTIRIGHRTTAGAFTERFRVHNDGSLLADGSNKIWHAGNDGAGSGLDADLLDGKQASEFLGASGSQTWTAGTFIFDGTGTPIIRMQREGGIDSNVTTHYRQASFNTYVGVNPSGEFAVGSSSNLAGARMFHVSRDGEAYLSNNNKIWHAANDGAGSGLDADLLDGKHASAFAELSGASFTGQLITAGMGSAQSGTAAAPSLGIGDNDTGLFRPAFNIMAVTCGGAETARFQADLFNLSTNLTISTGAPIIKMAETDTGQAWNLVADSSTLSIREGDTSSANTRFAIAPNSKRLELTAGDLQWDGAKVWTAANDGSGSGLDADLLDGKHASAFAEMADFVGSLAAASGWTKLPNGMILQAVQYSATANSARSVSFPTAFPNSCIAAVVSGASGMGTDSKDNPTQVTSTSKTAAQTYSADDTTATGYLIAIGY